MKKYIFLFLSLISITAFCIAQQEKAQEQEHVIYVISFEGTIYPGLAKSTKEKLAKVDVSKAKLVILEIDTPGGYVDATVEVCKEIDRLGSQNVPVYAYVIGEAMSGGALVAVACDKIYMKQLARIGAAQVKTHSIEGTKDAPEKYQADMRARFRNYAEKRGYPPAVAEKMVDPDIEVKEVVYRGKHLYLKPEEIQKLRNEAKDPKDVEDLGTLLPVGKLGAFTAKEAKTFEICREIYETREELLKGTNHESYPINHINVTTEDVIANFLTNRVVCFFLIAIGILGILIEIWTPGFGIPGIVGLICLALFFIGGYMTKTTAIWEILLFILGVGLLALEIFVIPGFGIAGISGLICCFLAILLSLQAFSVPRNESEMTIFITNLLTITLGVGVDVLAVILLSKYMPESAPLQRLSVALVQKAEDGYSTAVPGWEKLRDKQGVAISPLRPAGRIQIDGEAYDAMSQGDFIETGQRIKVSEIRGNCIVVEKERLV